MCGIAGGSSKNRLDSSVFREASACILHRGPDAEGYFLSDADNVFLGHRRLSIVDLSDSANQPMHSACGRYAMVYNGEVYNARALKDKLNGHSWRTHSDTEVVLELFAAFGTASFSWLNGMFALAIYDKIEDKLILCRDQVGIKPLFYYWDQNDFFFASELKFIRSYFRSLGSKLNINRSAVPYFLHLGFIPEPLTIYDSVSKFPAGHFAIIDVKMAAFSLHSYWSAKDHYLTERIADEEQALDLYRKTLFESTTDQMISDVPLGTFLSGGIDSSLVTAIASKVLPSKINSFSIGFKEARYDESAYAADVAKHLGTIHHSLMVSADDVLELVPSLLGVYDEPFADSSAFPTMLVSKLARQHVTVALSGDGGDELFQGYGMYIWAKRLHNPLLRMLRKPAYAITQIMDNRMKRGGSLFNYPSARRIHSHIFSQEQYFFSEQELDHMLTGIDFDFGELNDLPVGRNPGNPAEQQALWDLTHYLKDDLLVKVDRASMRYSLETRVPLLDLRLIELGLNIDYNLKVWKPLGTKYLMKRLLYEMVPQHLFERPKRGFAIPLKEWLYGPLKYLVDKYLNTATVQQFGYVNNDAVQQLLKRFYAGEDYLYNRVWVLLVLHWWLKEFDDAN